MTKLQFKSDMNVELIQHVGTDETVARSARVSTGNDHLVTPKIEGLINYLVREKHTSTLEHCTITVSVEAPIFVAREFMRHRTMSYNEISARYSKLEPVFYIPADDRPLVNQGNGAHPELVTGTKNQAGLTKTLHAYAYGAAWEAYEQMIAEGVATEVARSVLPVGVYTRFYATANLNNWFKFLWLRNGDNGSPQYEIVDVAKQIESFIAELYPVTYEAWRKTL